MKCWVCVRVWPLPSVMTVWSPLELMWSAVTSTLFKSISGQRKKQPTQRASSLLCRKPFLVTEWWHCPSGRWFPLPSPWPYQVVYQQPSPLFVWSMSHLLHQFNSPCMMILWLYVCQSMWSSMYKIFSHFKSGLQTLLTFQKRKAFF